jgi:hypothetical protein
MHYKFLLLTGKAGNRVQTDHAMMVMMASHRERVASAAKLGINARTVAGNAVEVVLRWKKTNLT